jgi:predicted MarR family transcription regulator
MPLCCAEQRARLEASTTNTKDTGMSQKRPDAASEQTSLDETANLGQLMTQFELGMIVAKNSFDQWVSRCGAAAGMNGYSPLELLILHMIDYNSRPKRIADICFGLKIEDTHLVSYALKKLSKAQLVESKKHGKETFFSNTEAGSRIVQTYQDVREKILINSLAMLSSERLDLDKLAQTMRTLAAMYEQAARNVETSQF